MIMNKKENGMYEYKGQEIQPFFSGDRKFCPNHVIKEYYRDEQARIDGQLNKKQAVYTGTSISDDIDEFLRECE